MTNLGERERERWHFIHFLSHIQKKINLILVLRSQWLIREINKFKLHFPHKQQITLILTT
jgi:hypothetical protein